MNSRPFNEYFGLEILSREKRMAPAVFAVKMGNEKLSFNCQSEIKLNMNAAAASVLASEHDGNPVLTCNNYGKGKIFFLSVPIETYLANLPGAFHTDEAQPFWKIYNHIADPFIRKNRSVSKDNPFIGITEHPVSDTERVVVVINYSREKIKTALRFSEGWEAGDFISKGVIHGEKIEITPEHPLILKVMKK
ncbi:MAG: hypothetical protein UW19_C0003G0042 [Candidatus Moranbacteria bacterium GW2011_GWF2_44_10]|nr:MAG: hypothetical protein UW19_C0003G0042 [Candidatus Moranbacteria bacterium GW2011_GWF2_44_10]